MTARWLRRRSWSAVGGLALVLGGLAVTQWVKDHRELKRRVFRIGFENSAVSQFVGPDGKPRGPAIEIVREAARRAGIQLEWVRVTGGANYGLIEGIVDLWPIMAKYRDREGLVYISLPWRTQRHWLMTRPSSQAPPARIAFIADGPTGRVLRMTGLSQRILVPRNTMPEVITALCSGEADGALLPEGPSFPAYNARPRICDHVELKSELLPEGTLKYGIGAGIRDRMAQRAADAIRTAMPSLALDGTLAEIQLRWSLISTNDLLVISELEAARRRNYQFAAVTLLLALLAVAFLRQNASLREARRAADRALEAKESFLANMSHEIRTPMNGIVGAAELLLDGSLDAGQLDHVHTIYGSATCLVGILNDILDCSKLEAGKLALETTGFDLLEVSESVIDLLGPVSLQAGVELILDFDPALRRGFTGDPGRIRQVLINLVGNAVKFTERGHVLARASLLSETGGSCLVRVEVEDTGIGIPPDALGRLFQKFTQADASTTRKYGGSGLGLSICRQLVELMGGRLGAESREGEGSRFWFEIPLAATSEPRPIPASSRTALVVSSFEPLRNAVVRQLAAMGLLVNAAAAVDDTSGPLPDLLVVDEPDPDVLERLGQGSRIVVLRGARPAAEFQRAWRSVRKPVTCSKLEGAIDGPEAQPRRPRPATRRDFNGLRVLVAEDNVVNQKVISRMLESLGCVPEVTSNGLEALERAEERPFDLILMDCQMPEMDGFEATRRLRVRGGASAATHIVALTAAAMEEHRRLCLEAGMDDYVTKPISLSSLEDLLARWAPAGA